MARQLTDAECKQALRLLKAHGGNYTAAARVLHISHSSFFHRYDVACRRFPEMAKKLAPEPKTITEHAEVHRSRSDEQTAQHKLRDALKEISRLSDRIKDLEWAAKASYSPAEWTLRVRENKKREHIPALLVSDQQIGEVIRAEETETGYGYDAGIFSARYRQMIDTTIYLCFDHGGTGWQYPGIIYGRGGDTISGGIHDELRETDDLTPIQAVELAFEEEAAGITKLADAFGRVEVEAPGGAGNHDRNTFKPQSKQAWAHSYDYLIMVMLANHFRGDKRVTFHTSKSFDVRFNIYERRIILTHGDRMGSRGGQGFIGPAATILRGVQKVMTEQAALGFYVDEVWHGHFHYEMHLPFVKSNGCFPGYSEYAKQYRMRPALPMQQLNIYHAKHGNVDYKPLILTEK